MPNQLSHPRANLKKVYFEFYGCAANRFDLEIILGILAAAGYDFVAEPGSADIILVHTCGVKKATEDKILHRLKLLSSLKKPTVVSGCLPKIDLGAVVRASPNAAFLDPNSIHKILTAIESLVDGGPKVFFSSRPPLKPSLPRFRLNRLIGVVQVAEGCLGNCSYCCTKFARGKLVSYPPEHILRNVKEALEGGALEIWLTGQDLGAYGRDIGTNLIDLVERIVALPYDFKVRLGMMNPSFALEAVDGLKRVYSSEKVYKFAHLPVQSGSNLMLKEMNRPYTVEDFKWVVDELRGEVDGISIATDVIVGYPTETDEEFKATLNLLKEVKPDITNISKYAHRPRTKASLLPQLPSTLVAERSRILSKLSSRIALERNMRLVGRRETVLITEKSSAGSYVGRMPNYKKVLVPSSKDLMRLKRIDVKITNATERYLIGSVNFAPNPA